MRVITKEAVSVKTVRITLLASTVNCVPTGTGDLLKRVNMRLASHVIATANLLLAHVNLTLDVVTANHSIQETAVIVVLRATTISLNADLATATTMELSMKYAYHSVMPVLANTTLPANIVMNVHLVSSISPTAEFVNAVEKEWHQTYATPTAVPVHV